MAVAAVAANAAFVISATAATGAKQRAATVAASLRTRLGTTHAASVVAAVSIGTENEKKNQEENKKKNQVNHAFASSGASRRLRRHRTHRAHEYSGAHWKKHHDGMKTPFVIQHVFGLRAVVDHSTDQIFRAYWQFLTRNHDTLAPFLAPHDPVSFPLNGKTAMADNG
jgi:hypothetical protein